MGGLSIENGASLQKLADYWELRKRNYSTRLARVTLGQAEQEQ